MIFSKSQMKPSTNLFSQPNIAPPGTLISICSMTVIDDMMMILISKAICTCEKINSALCKLSFAFVNDKLQEAEWDKQNLADAGARTVLSIWYMPVTSKWFMTLISRAEPFLLDASQIETARSEKRRAVMSRAYWARVKTESVRNEHPFCSFDSGRSMPCGTFIWRAI